MLQRISIHALREEGDETNYANAKAAGLFLSTPSARRATERKPDDACDRRDFYPRPPRGGRPVTSRAITTLWNFYPRPPRGGRLLYELDGFTEYTISIHALREEGDICSMLSQFSSSISIHALREEGDRPRRAPSAASPNFYPRPQRGGRLGCCGELSVDVNISIHALREEGDPRNLLSMSILYNISIHALREEGDPTCIL